LRGTDTTGVQVPCGFFEAGCDAPELLELSEAAFDEMALGIEMLVERISERTGRVVGMTARAPSGRADL
jgi:hypothetical protein